MAKAVGLDIGSHSCKVAVLDGGAKSAKLVRYVERVYEREEGQVLSPAAVIDAVRAAMSAAKAPKNAVSVALATEQCILRELSCPFSSDDQIAKVIKFEFEPHLHSAAIEDVVLDFIKTGVTRQGTRLLVFACMKDVLRARLDALKLAGVDPLHLDVGVAALFNVAHASGVLEEHPDCLIIDIGARTTKALYVQDGRLKVARSMRLGSDSVEQKLTRDLEGDDKAAAKALSEAQLVEALAQAPDDPASTLEIVHSVEALEGAVARSRQNEFMSRVLRETQRTIPTIADDAAPTCVFLTGGGSHHAHARERIASHFGVEVRDLPVADAIEHKLPPSEAESMAVTGAVAVGTALKVLGMDAAGIDLRKEDFRFARTFDQIKTALATGVTLLFFAVFLMFLTQVTRWKKAKAEFGQLQVVVNTELNTEVFDAYEDAVHKPKKGTIKKDIDGYFVSVTRRVNGIRDHLQNELGLATSVPPILSCLRTWGAVMESIKTVRGKVKYLAIKEESYEQDEAKVVFVVGDFKDGDTIADAIRAHTDVFSAVTTGSAKARRDGKGLEIEINMVLQQPKAPDDEDDTSAAPPVATGVETAKGSVR